MKLPSLKTDIKLINLLLFFICMLSAHLLAEVKTINIEQELLDEILNDYQKLSIEDRIIFKGHLSTRVYGIPDPLNFVDYKNKPKIYAIIIKLIWLINSAQEMNQINDVDILQLVYKFILAEFDINIIKSDAETKLESFYQMQIGNGRDFESVIRNILYYATNKLDDDSKLDEFIEFLKLIFNENLSYIVFAQNTKDEFLKTYTEKNYSNLLKNPKLRFIDEAYAALCKQLHDATSLKDVTSIIAQYT